MADTTRQLVDLVFEGTVAAGATDLDVLGGGPIPTGETWRLTKFGASEVGAGDGVASAIAIQRFNGTTWKTIRGFGLSSTAFELELGTDYIGDGTLQLRIVRQNNSSAAKQIIAWVIGIKLPA